METFNDLKKVISDTPIMAYFDPEKELVIQVDSSKDGLGAGLLQDGNPIKYASRSLTPAESRLAQIEN